MRDAARNFLIGSTSIFALLALATLLLLFGELDSLIRPRYVVTLNTDHAAGLRPGSSVELNGVPIGVIDKITVQEHAEYPVRVVALIDQRVLIPANAVPYTASSLLGGASILEMKAAATTEDIGFLPSDGSASISAPVRFRMIEQITKELDTRMKPILEALTEFRQLSAEYTAFGRSLNELLAPQSEEDLAEGEQPNLHTAIAKLYDVLAAAEDALNLAQDWLGDEQMRANAGKAVENATKLIEQASAAVESFTGMVQAIQTDSDEITAHLLPVADELAATLEEVRRVTRLASEGEGTVALLLNNPDLYNSLDDAARRLDRALREIELYIQKVKAEGMPVQF